MKSMALKELKRGEYFTMKDYGEYPTENQVYIRGDYIHGENKYEVYKWSDVNACRSMKGTKTVYVDFTF